LRFSLNYCKAQLASSNQNPSFVLRHDTYTMRIHDKNFVQRQCCSRTLPSGYIVRPWRGL
jgi:hypothetical protein